MSSLFPDFAAPHAAFALLRHAAPTLFSLLLCASLAACSGENQVTLNMTPPPGQGTTGNLDLSFGGSGYFDVRGPNSEPISFAGLKPLPGGGYLIAGSWDSGSGSNARQTWFATKIRADGTTDTAYGTGGSITWERPYTAGTLNRLLVDAQGRALFVGQRCTVGLCGPGDAAQRSFSIDVRRFNANGTPDATFGADSVFSRLGYRGGGLDAHLQADGRIVIATTLDGDAARSPLHEEWFRLTANGELDATFADFPSSQVPVTDATLNFSSPLLLSQPDGKLINGHQRTLSRFSAQGVLDTTFAGRGWTQIAENVSALAMDQPGNLYAFGRTVVGGNAVVQALYRVPINDATATPLRTGADDLGSAIVSAMAVQADGKIVLAGSVTDAPPNNSGGSFVARRLANGAADTSFAAESSRKMAIYGMGFPVKTGAVLLDASGRILIAGQSGTRLFVLRYLP